MLCLITHMYIVLFESRSVHEHIRCYQYIRTYNSLTYSLLLGSWNSHFHRCTKDSLKSYISATLICLLSLMLVYFTFQILIEIIHSSENEVLVDLMLRKAIVCNVIFLFSLVLRQ